MGTINKINFTFLLVLPILLPSQGNQADNQRGYSMKMNSDQKVVALKAIRSSFNETQRDLLTLTYMGDEYLLEKVKQMQAEYSLFRTMCDDLKENDKEAYEKFSR